MRIAVDHHVLREAYGEEKAFWVLKEAGFDETDYSFHEWPDDDPLLGKEFIVYANKVKSVMDSAGIVCEQCHAPFAYDACEPMDDTSVHFIAVKRAIAAAGILGADHIAVHSLYIPGATKKEEWITNIRYFRALEPICRKAGVRIALENLPLQVTETPEAINRMLEELDSPWFAALLDTGHARISGIEPDDFIRRLSPGSLCGVHIQDQHGKKDEHIIPFMGETNWEGFAKALKESGYRGPMALEVVHFMEALPVSLLPAAYEYAASVARFLVAKCE